MTVEKFFVPLKRQIRGIWPTDIFELPDPEALNNVWIAPAEILWDDGKTWFETGILFESCLVLKLLGLDAVSLSLGDPALGTEIGLTVQIRPDFRITLGPVTLFLNLSTDLLVTAERIDDDRGGPPEFRPLPEQKVCIRVADIALSCDLNGNLNVQGDDAVSLPPVMIGRSGVVVEATNLRPILSEESAASLGGTFPPGTRGIFVEDATIYLPAGLSVALPSDVQIEDAFIGTAGFSGKITGSNWNPSLTSDGKRYRDGDSGAGEILGIPFGLKSISLELRDNVPIASDIRGGLILPYFDQEIEVRINLLATEDLIGDFSITVFATGEDGITLTKEELLALSVKSLTVAKEGDVGSVAVSGGLEPLLMASDGLEWPRLDVKDLYIDTEGKFKIAEAWLDLKELATLDLWGFHFELNRVGIGYDEPQDKLWIDLTGSLRLIEQIPVGMGIEGFRLTWPRTLFEMLQITGPPTLDDVLNIAEELEVKFDGIYLFFGVPDAVEFEGYIRFIKEAQKVGFAGDMALRVPAAGFAAEAGLMVGMNFESPPFPFLYVYLGAEFPAGIPLGIGQFQSGLALKGVLGLFGLNVSPDKTPEQNWYYDWYKRGPVIGAHPTNKWRDERMAVALGVGVTITTVDGYIKGMRGLLVLAIPGPILVLEGRALILDGLLPAEPPLRALAVFDGKEKTVQFNIEAEAELIEDMLRAYGMLEAFFDFEDITNWHLYLGQDQPEDRRIQANILKWNDRFLFDANAYLMVDMIDSYTMRSRMGVFVGFRPTLPPLGPVEVEIDATLEGKGQVTIFPEQFSGDIRLSAKGKISAFGFGVQFAADAGVLTEGPEPFKVHADLSIKVKLPDPLDPFETKLLLNWESPAVPDISPPLVSASANSEFTPGGVTLALHDSQNRPNRQAEAKASPVVPIDTRPTLVFGHDMNDESGDESHSFFGTDGGGNERHYNVGLLRFAPKLIKVKLYKRSKSREWANTAWDSVASSSPDSGDEPLWGVWLADAAPENPAVPGARRLCLWTTNPFVSAAGSTGTSYTESFVETYSDYGTCRGTEPRMTCIGFEKPDPHEKTWHYRSLTFLLPEDGRWQRQGEGILGVEGGLSIRFEEKVRRVTIRFAQDSQLPPKLEWIMVGKTARQVRETVYEDPQPSQVVDPYPCPLGLDTREYNLGYDGLVLFIEAGAAFDCLELPGSFAVVEICYMTEAEINRAARAERQCRTNTLFVQCFHREPPILDPGCYYRLVIETSLKVDVRRINGPDPVDILNEALYDDIRKRLMSNLNVSESAEKIDYTHEAFFQTEGPPTNLLRYVKWSNPQPQEIGIFREEDFAIRFLRQNVHKMYASERHMLHVMLRNMQGNLVSGFDSLWSKAGSTSLLPEERIWMQHMGENPDDPNSGIPHDDILELVPRHATPALKPRARYELMVVGGEGGRLLFMDDFFEKSLSEIMQHSVQGWSEVSEEILSKTGGGRLIVAGDSNWTDIVLNIDARTEGDGTLGVVFRYLEEPKHSNEPAATYYQFSFTPEKLVLKRGTEAITPPEAYPDLYQAGQWVRITISAVANRIRVWLFDSLIYDFNFFEAKNRWKAHEAGRIFGIPTANLRDSALLRMEEILDWFGLCAKLDPLMNLERASPGGRIWELLTSELQEIVHEIVLRIGSENQAAYASETVTLLEALNESIIKKHNFYIEDYFRSIDLSEVNVALLDGDRDRLSGAEIQRLNRLLLEAAFPQEIKRMDPEGLDVQSGINSGILVAAKPMRGKIGLFANNSNISYSHMRVREAVLHRTTFTTSAFKSFHDLIRSFDNSPSSIRIGSLVETDLNECVQKSQRLAFEAWEFQRAMVNFRDELLEGGREKLEQKRIDLRNAKADLFQAFLGLCEEKEIPYYNPMSEKLEIYCLKPKERSSLLGFWIRIPESLDLRFVVTDTTDTQGGVIGVIGRVEIALGAEVEDDPDREGSFPPQIKDILNLAGLGSKIAEDGQKRQPSPERRIWDLLDPNGKETFKKIAQSQSLSAGHRSDAIDALNRVLKRQDLYHKKYFSDSNILGKARKFLRKGSFALSHADLFKLNQMLMEGFYPHGIQWSSWAPLNFTMAHNPDCTQLILLPDIGNLFRKPRRSYKFIFNYYRNYGDEDEVIDHRFDRLVKKWKRSDSMDTVSLQLW